MNRPFFLGFAGFCALSLGSIGSLPADETPAPLKIGIIGDSTVCNYPLFNPRRGWGQMLPDFFVAGTNFLNLAEGGRSTKTFPPAKFEQELAYKPDFLLVQFGHNDSHAKTNPESTDAATDFRDNLRKMVERIRQAGIAPIFVTPPHRRTYVAGTSTLTRELEPYASAMKAVADELHVPVVDLYAKSGALMESLGDAGSDAFTINNAFNEDKPAAADRTHFTPKGATEMARLVAAGLAEADSRLKAALKPEFKPEAAPTP